MSIEWIIARNRSDFENTPLLQWYLGISWIQYQKKEMA